LEISKGDNMKLSRLKEIIKEELGDEGLLYFESTDTYIWNFNKTYDERLRILKINPYEIIHTIEPTTEMQLIAVESRPNLIGKINKPAEEIQKIALNKDLFQYRYIKDVTENTLRYYLQILKEKVKKDNLYEELEVYDLKQGLEELLINKDIENDL
jgi:hypothetical protein